jgi:galactosamine-6-phosphate isomerase
MNIQICSDYEDLSKRAKDLIIRQLIKTPKLLLCAATGSSPTLTYQLLHQEYQQNNSLFNQMSVIKLDEWGGVSMENPYSCEAYLQKYLLQPLGIDNNRYIGFDSQSQSPEKECDRINTFLKENAKIDICVLGLGMNGHIAFNEPAQELNPFAHVADLSTDSMQHPMSLNMNEQISYGLTLGMSQILQSQLILLLISGIAKQAITQKFLSQKITTLLPASFLWLHANVACLIDKDAAG